MAKLNTTPEQRAAVIAERDDRAETGGVLGLRVFEAAALAEDVETVLAALRRYLAVDDHMAHCPDCIHHKTCAEVSRLAHDAQAMAAALLDGGAA